jgi:hypothetical protein
VQTSSSSFIPRLLGQEEGGEGKSGGTATELLWSAAILFLRALDDVMNVLVDEYSVPKSIDEEKAEKNCGGLNDRWAQTSEKSFPKEDFSAPSTRMQSPVTMAATFETR